MTNLYVLEQQFEWRQEKTLFAYEKTKAQLISFFVFAL